ncbi:hypothetical protein FRX31_015814 [Thalictrum thalictroides]|uniref:Uncharacterized protein n=1 Tax=Thalictrum thalictroides TaxID=46969 RepID=A0A7J6WDC7_THATH|nr:hypothetical protein FRX31_015814 [Thalictrum thalictroides]
MAKDSPGTRYKHPDNNKSSNGGGKTHYLREYYHANQLNFLEGLKVVSYEDEILSFTEKDLIGVFWPHNDALVITVWVAMWRVQRIMVDVGSSASVLFFTCYSQMKLAGDLIIPEDNLVVGFDGTAAKAVGRISLTINVGHEVVDVYFFLMDCKSSNNAIFGRDWIHSMEDVPSSLH